MQFSTFQYADISTRYVEDDLSRMLDEKCPGHLANLDGYEGSFFYVSEEFDEQVAEWRKFGMSERFVAIMTEIRNQGILFVRFDRDGMDVIGLEV